MLEETIAIVPSDTKGIGFNGEGKKVFYGFCAAIIAVAMFYVGWEAEAKTVILTVVGACLAGMQGGDK